ncbi:hypothetical protein E2C01_013340 [Portunus trituberculatus]|uniref:Uncharacterized protein n=1 Tax=Portunus trituberculatus TaxID=210409 RepID=A0A5B7DH07_PORTR|nr:hypothetical protein [Portunus trituberculatus]
MKLSNHTKKLMVKMHPSSEGVNLVKSCHLLPGEWRRNINIPMCVCVCV